MRAVLAHPDLDEALDGFGGEEQRAWTDDEKRKDRNAKSMIHLHISNNILQEVLEELLCRKRCSHLRKMAHGML